ncbi:MAG: peroxide stress protein YaaA [Pseudomonadota bacterium]|jgi:cytoplasmic iron level regulating protein YaaA (DUF328/UPF0246 family)
MLFVLSPAKALDFETPLPVTTPALTHTQPLFVPQASELIEVLRPQSPPQIASLMKLSDKLAALNVARYAAWTPEFTPDNARQAVLAFNGDVYDGLHARSLTGADLEWLQQHLCILSGLYGVLRPLDLMQPYRLEMGTRLSTRRGANLYQFWGDQIAHYLNTRTEADSRPVLVNLASEEYFKAVDRKRLHPRVLTCVFEERKGAGYQVVSFMAKRARGLMMRFATQQRVQQPEQLQAFDAEGYRFVAAASEPDRWVFRRETKLTSP